MRSINVLRVVLACLLLSGMVLAQGLGASGDIRGTVTDPSGAVVSSAVVTATDVDKGVKHTINSDNDGQFHFSGLPPATYSVSVTKTGFQPAIAKNVVVTIGQTNTLNFPLKVSQVSEQVEVTTEVPVVETERGSQANVVSDQYIRDLPINRRDYLTFTLLAPGVSDSTRLASDQDFRVKQTPQSGLSFYGSNGRGNSVTVDGGEANDDAGGVRLTVGQDAVDEFQINRSNYGADLGGASGASINIVTKSGTNNVHGTLFGFFRNDSLDAQNPFSFTQALQPGQAFNPLGSDVSGQPVKDSLTRQQFGASIGLPITKDKTWLFASFEGLRQDAQNSVPILTNTSVLRPDSGILSGNQQTPIINGLAALGGSVNVPCLTGQPALPANICAGILTNVLTVNNTTPTGNFLVNELESNGGLFPYTTREYQTSARLDHQFSDRDQVFLRYSFAHDREENPDVQSLTGFTRGSSVAPAYDHTLQGAWFHQFSPNTLNELHLQWNYSNFDVVPNVLGQAGLDLPGFANIGTQIFLPNFTIMRRYEFADNVTLNRGKHAFKFGGYELIRGNHTESDTFFPGRFVFGTLPGGLLSPCLQVPAACGLAQASPSNCQLVNGQFQTPTPGTVCFPAGINALQSAALGLPEFYQQGFGNPTYNYPRPFTAFYAQDQWAVKPNLTLTYGLRYELDAQYGPLATGKKNFAPRASFAWDPMNNRRFAVRGGFGIYYSPIYGQIADVVQTLGLVNGIRPIAQVFVPLTGAPGNPALNSAVIYQTLFAEHKIPCASIPAGNAACITPADLTQFGINVTNSGPVPPLSVLFSGQPDYKSPYSMQGSFGVEGEVAKGLSVSVSGIYVHTLRLPVALDTNLLPAPFTTAVSPFTGQSVSFQNWAAPQCGANPFSCFVNPLLLQGDQYSSKASALYEGVIFEVKKRFTDHFTLFGNYTFSKAFDTSTDFNSDFAPFNQLDLNADRALSDFDQRHKVVVASVFDTGNHGGPFFSGFQLSPIVRYNSGHPFNILAGGTDINGDRHSTNDRPLGVPRNSGQGPDFFDFDLRLTKGVKLGEKSQLQFIAEGFNLFNRTNFASVNNEVPTLNGFTAINPNSSGHFVNPSVVNPGGAPLAFTSAFPMRQIQLGVRLAF